MAVEKKKPEAPLSDKKKALETAISQIEKNFGKGTVMRLGDRPEMNVEAIPTGSLALDAALGIGGVPKGRIIEIYGPESSGKTTLALHIVAQAQKRGGEVAFVDAEHALDPDYAARIGVDIDSMLVSQPDTGEQALEFTDSVIGTMIALYMPAVVALIYVAAIVSAVLTTANSSLLSASICVTNDIYAGMINKNATEKQKLLVSKLSIAVFILLALLLTTQFTTIISMMFVTYTINALIAIPLFAGLYGKKGGALAANLSLILGAASVIIWLLLGTPFGIHVAIVGLPMAGLGYLIGMVVGDKPTEAQLKAIADAGMKISN